MKRRESRWYYCTQQFPFHALLHMQPDYLPGSDPALFAVPPRPDFPHLTHSYDSLSPSSHAAA